MHMRVFHGQIDALAFHDDGGLVLSFAGCGSDHYSPSAEREPEMVLRRGLGGEPGSLDPAAAIDTFSMEVLAIYTKG